MKIDTDKKFKAKEQLIATSIGVDSISETPEADCAKYRLLKDK
ncbi:hypothetical protein [Clostridium gasigenes]|nr:hypothetical protein [Clostridium gasigenes]